MGKISPEVRAESRQPQEGDPIQALEKERARAFDILSEEKKEKGKEPWLASSAFVPPQHSKAFREHIGYPFEGLAQLASTLTRKLKEVLHESSPSVRFKKKISRENVRRLKREKLRGRGWSDEQIEQAFKAQDWFEAQQRKVVAKEANLPYHGAEAYAKRLEQELDEKLLALEAGEPGARYIFLIKEILKLVIDAERLTKSIKRFKAFKHPTSKRAQMILDELVEDAENLRRSLIQCKEARDNALIGAQKWQKETDWNLALKAGKAELKRIKGILEKFKIDRELLDPIESYNKRLDKIYDRFLAETETSEANIIALDSMPEEVKEERLIQLKKKLEEYNTRIMETWENPYQPFWERSEDDRYRRDILRLVLERGIVNIQALSKALAELEKENSISDGPEHWSFTNACGVIKDYITTGGEGVTGGTGLPELKKPKEETG